MRITRPMLAHSLSARRMRHGLNVTLLCALGSCALPAFSGAQQTRGIPLLSELPIVGKLFLKRQDAPVESPARSLLVNVEAKGATLGTVVDLLMDQAHASYTLDARLTALPTGNVKLRKVPFSVALETILKMSHGRATYRVENGIYSIIEREATPVESAETNAPKTTKEDGSASTVTPEIAAKPNGGGAAETLLSLDAVNSDLSSVLKQIAAQAKIVIVLDPSLRDVPLTMHMNNVPLRIGLDALIRGLSKPATYRIENGVYKIIPRPADAPDDTVPSEVAAFPISLDANKTDLYSVLKLVFAQVKTNYTLDPALRSISVTAHFHSVPLSTVLETLLKGTGKPLTYRVENGIWSIVPKM